MATSVYFFNSLVALEVARTSQDSNDFFFFYDGKPLSEAPLNCISVPINKFYDYFLQTTHPQISQLNFDNVNFSDEIKSQITKSITETLVSIQNQKIEIINTLLASEIDEQNISVMIFSFLKHLLEGANEEATIELITKLLKIVMYLKGQSYKQSDEVAIFISKLTTILQTQKLNMHNIFLEFVLKNLQDKSMFHENRISCLKQIVKHKDMANVFNQFHYIKNIYPQSEFEEYLSELAKVVFSDDFFDLDTLEQKERIYKFFYCTNNVYEFGKEFQIMYKAMYPIFVQAIEKELDELVMSLYYPLQFSWNGVAQTQEEHKQFNDEVELKLESFIKNTMIQKYKLKPNSRKIKPNQKKIKVAFLVHRILNLSVNSVMTSLLKSLKENPNEQYEFIVYDFNLMEMLGSDPKEVAKLKELGFKYVDLHERCVKDKYPLYSIVEKSLKVREALIDDKVDILIGYHNRAEYNFLFTSRTAPKQIYWSHGNNEYDIENIDQKICHFNAPENPDFDMFSVSFEESHYNPAVDINEVKKARESYPKGSFILGTIGRLIKIDDDEYLQAVASIMKKNPQTIYLACGSGEKDSIKKKVEQLGVADRFFFTGHVNANIYGHVIDLWLTPFLFGGGEALQEYRNKGKPYVVIQENSCNIKEGKNLTKRIANIKNLKEPSYMSSLYSNEELNYLKKTGYINPVNKQVQSFFTISFALTKEDYISISNELISNETLRNKTTQEYLYFINQQSKNNGLDSFYKLLYWNN